MAEISIETLTTDDMNQIEKESILGLAPSLRTEEALGFRKLMDKQVADIVKRGRIPDIPAEWGGGAPPRVSPRAVLRREPRRGEVEISNLERSIREAEPHDHPHGDECCPPGDEPEHQEKLRAVVKKIYGDDSPLR